MSAFVGLLGETLVGKDGAELKTSEVLSNKKAIGLYFSAHWCPPCRGFTPQLAKKYTDVFKEKGLEIVFVSSDKDEGQFKDYFGEMPWLALPYSDRDKKNALSKKFKVQGIPSFVILDGATGNLNTTDGRSKIDDADGFPWTPKPFAEILGDAFVGKDGASIGLEAIKDKTLGLYFSAHWCPPCRGFTPDLAKVYEKVKAKHPNFEIVFVSSDRDENAFKEYFAEMPWLALPYSKRSEKEALSGLFEVQGIPSLVIVDMAQGGKVINKSARASVGADKEGDNFPWTPKLVNNLAETCEGIDEQPSFLAFAYGDKASEVEKTVNAVAEELKNKEEEGDDEFLFFVSTDPSGGPMPQLNKLCGIEENDDVKGGVLLDFENGTFYVLKEAVNDTKSLKSFLTLFKEGKLESKQLKQ